MALGIARNAQTAGWGVGPARAEITGAGVMAYTMYDTPTFSFLRNTSSRGGSTEPGSFNATGLGSISGYNTARFTVLANFYLPWAGGLSDSFYGAPCQGEFKIGGAGPGFFNIITNIVGGALSINGGLGWSGSNGYNSVALPGAYTAWTNTWLTAVLCSSETPSSYTSWAGSGSGSSYGRVAVYNTLTGAFIAKVDTVYSYTTPPWSSWPSSVNAAASGNDYLVLSSTGNNGQQLRNNQQSVWLGSMWDPLTVTDTTWLTPRPTATLGNSGAGTAFSNLTYSDYAYDGVSLYTTIEHFGDLYTPTTADQVYRLTNDGTAEFNTGYSNSIYPTSQGQG